MNHARSVAGSSPASISCPACAWWASAVQQVWAVALGGLEDADVWIVAGVCLRQRVWLIPVRDFTQRWMPSLAILRQSIPLHLVCQLSMGPLGMAVRTYMVSSDTFKWITRSTATYAYCGGRCT
jgi:hypothetical protein